MPRLTRNPNAAKLGHPRLAQRSSVKWTRPTTSYMAGKTKAARAAGRERQNERFIQAATAWYAMQNGA